LEKWRRGGANVPAQSDTHVLGWAKDVERAFWEAETALRATYSTLANEARGLASAAEQLDAALRRTPLETPEPHQVEKISQSITRLEAGLASYQRDANA
jgi:hypothetical protein